MSKVPFNPRAATHALRGLALGTSCSLILISEERRRRLDLARTLVDNGRLIKAQRCYSTAGAATATLQAERPADTLAREGDIASNPEFSWPGVALGEERLVPPRPSLPPKRSRRIIPPQQEPATRARPVATTEPAPIDAEPLPDKAQHHVTKPVAGEDDADYRAFANKFQTLRQLPDLPPEFLESTMSWLRELEQEDRVRTAQRVIDRLCHHTATNSQHFEGINPEFFLRCALSSRKHARASSRPNARFKMAVHLFWTHRQSLATREEGTKLMEMMAELFAAEDAEHAAQSFLATSRMQFGRYATVKRVVVPIAYLYRKQGKTAILDRWMELAEKADVPMSACYDGSNLIRNWEFQDGPEAMRTPMGKRVMKLSKQLRRPLYLELKSLNEEQRGLFERMDEKAKNWDWEGVLSFYSKALDAGVERSIPCLRLAVEAAVGHEDIHSPKALTLIEEAHKASLDVDPVIQCLVLSRFDAILSHYKRNTSIHTRGQAYQTMQKLLDMVQPYYEQPSEIVYNRAIRICLRLFEVREARDQCLRLANEHWDNDVLKKSSNFANLVSVAVSSRDFELLQKLLEALPWKSYLNDDVCKKALRDAQSTLLVMSRKAKTMEEMYRFQAPLGAVGMALQGVLQARAAKHEKVKKGVKYQAFRWSTPSDSQGGKVAKKGAAVGGVDLRGDGQADGDLQPEHVPGAAPAEHTGPTSEIVP